jgi:nicotinate-nucleotide adenylyltransferase
MEERDPLQRLGRSARMRLGIMGGAFDPIHIAHLVTAEEALMQFGLDEVVFMPAGNPPHKTRQMAPAEFRYLLVCAATASHPCFSVSRYEIDRQQVGYTVDTLEHVAAVIGPEAEIFFITGADAVLDILTWKAPARVLELCTLIAATRPGYDLSRLSAVFERLDSGVTDSSLDARVRAMEIPALAVSSSMIRERLASGKPIRYLVPDVVAQLIEKASLYAAPASRAPTEGEGGR